MSRDTDESIWKTKMLSTIQLLKKITPGESSSIEYKSVQISGTKLKAPKRNDLSDEIAAFANHKGGMVVFGISDRGDIEGIPADSVGGLIHIISKICHDSMEPSLIDFFVDSEQITDEHGNEKIIVYIEISQSLWLHQSSNGFFLRCENAKRKMTTEQLIRIAQSRSQARIIKFDEQFVPNAEKLNLDQNLIDRFLRHTRGGDEKNTQLLKRRLLVNDHDIDRPSVAGLLMCSYRSHDYLNNSFVCAVYYRGKEKDANYQIDAKDFKGPLDQQIIDSFKFVEKYNKISARKEVGRVEKTQYSMRAIFEAIVNTVIHRDYSRHEAKIRLFMFADRLEIYSPGALANTLTVETLQDNQATRNELLSRLLSEIQIDDNIAKQVHRKYFLERRGEGVGIILNESEQLSGQTPIYKMLGEELRLTIFAAASLQDT